MENLQHDIEKEIIKNRKLKDPAENKNLIILLILCVFIFLGSHQSQLICHQPLEISRGIFGDTWICTNKSCGYENYEGINYCGICGKYRYQ